MKTETIQYKDGDLTCVGYVAYDDKKSGKRPGILVWPEAFGLGEHAKKRAERLAELGYVAMASDPYGNAQTATDLPGAMKLATPLFGSPDVLRKRARAALDQLMKLPQTDTSRLAAMGFCMGGAFSIEMARSGAPLRGVVSFHGALQTALPAQTGQVKAKLLVCTGADDPMVPLAQVNGFQEEMTKAGADFQILTFGGTVHSFTNPDADSIGMAGIKYNKSADERSWKAMKDFFEEVFSG